MVSSNFLNDKRVKSLRSFNENYSFWMVLLFSLMPIMAIFDPQSFGPIFSTLSYIEIAALLILGVFQLISYASFDSRMYSTGDRLKACFINLKNILLKNKAASLLIIVYIWGALSAFMADDTTRSMVGTEFRPDGLLMYSCFASLFIFSSLVKKKSLRRGIFAVNIISFVLCALIIIQQYYGIIGSAGVKTAGAFGEYLSSIYDSYGIRYGHFFKGLTGPFYNLNHVGYFVVIGSMIISALFITSEKLFSKIMLGILAAFSYYTIIVNDTFGGYLAIGITLAIIPVIMIVKMKDRGIKGIINVLLPLIIFLLISASFFIGDSGNSISTNFATLGEDAKTIAGTEDIKQEEAGSGRLSMWVGTVEMIGERPIFGFGADNLKQHYVDRDLELDRAHNEPLEFAVSIGIPGAIMYYIAIGAILIIFLKRKNVFFKEESLAPMMSAVGYLVSSLVGVFLFYTGGYFFVMLGMVVASENEAKEDIISLKK